MYRLLWKIPIGVFVFISEYLVFTFELDPVDPQYLSAILTIKHKQEPSVGQKLGSFYEKNFF